MGLIYVGNPVKIAFFANPISMEDILATGELLTALELWQAALVVAPGALLLGLLVADFRRNRAGYAALGAATTVSVAFAMFPGVIAQGLDARFPPHPSNPTLSYEAMGGSLYLLREIATYLDKHRHPPSRNDVDVALHEEPDPPPPNNPLIRTAHASGSAGEKPRFDYIMTVSSHWPFKLDETKRPRFIHSTEPGSIADALCQ